ncbi:hypothetical protein ELI_01370 [Erythrobacter litoralis HTCC2594]|uniref:Uncharacterized protein n=1 Tax=Erythrobacter litoralis (strain HTCC2594) TaxID=314225 RepID=Q2ND75_ERYLH|nr:hypothetical protein ELI_01370 [Erythrobacter litoralis HTCC2594]
MKTAGFHSIIPDSGAAATDRGSRNKGKLDSRLRGNDEV